MSAIARSKGPSSVSRLGRSDRVAAVLAAVLGPALVWLAATVGLDLTLYQPGFGGVAPQELGILPVVITAGVAALAGAGVLALIERRSRRPAQVWLVVSTAVLILSLGAPLSGEGIDTANKLALALMHLAAGGVLIPLLYRSARRRQEANAPGPQAG